MAHLGLPLKKTGQQDIYSCKIGGYPVWLLTPYTDLKCVHCSEIMMLILQLYCEVQHDRILYFFACRKSECFFKKSFLFLRSLKERKNTSLVKDNFEIEIDSECSLDDLDALLSQKMNIAEDSKQSVFEGTAEKDFPCQAPVFFLDSVWDEKVELESCHEPIIEQPDSQWSNEVYEESSDILFDEFCETVQAYPNQVLRYSFQGSPLLYSNQFIPQIPNCVCGASRVFECQLMPALVTKLGLDFSFGTILFYSCGNDCSLNSYSKEFCFVMDEI